MKVVIEMDFTRWGGFNPRLVGITIIIILIMNTFIAPLSALVYNHGISIDLICIVLGVTGEFANRLTESFMVG